MGSSPAFTFRATIALSQLIRERSGAKAAPPIASEGFLARDLA